MSDGRRVVVVGGGVAGLTAAYRLARTQDPPSVTLLEAGDRVGGSVRSVRVGDLTLDAGPDSFVARKPWAVDLCRELGLDRELVAPGSSGAWLWTERGLVPMLRNAAFGIPGDVGDVLRWPGLSGAARRRAARDLLIRPRREEGDESLGSLLRRRLGDEATDLGVAPLLAGLFAGDVDHLSAAATFPELQRWESSQGSLIRGSQAARRAGGPDAGPMFLKLRDGTATLTDRLAQRLGDHVVRTGARVTEIRRTAAAFEVRTADGECVPADAVIVGTPAAPAADLLAGIAPAALGELTSASTAVIFLVYAEGTQTSLPDGTGFVVPRGRAPMTACTWLSSKWPREAFGTRAVLRCYVGSAGDDDVVDAPDDEMVEACARHLAALLPLPARAEHAEVVRWRGAMPQYEVGHRERVARIRSGLPAGIFMTGSAYDGVGIPDCVRAAGETADAAGAHLASTKETVG
ncbi:MAG: protoporphyrinogen oxidase [Actinomycetota bacterium]